MSTASFKRAAGSAVFGSLIALATACAVAPVSAADSGKFNMKYTENQPIPVEDAQGHAIYLGNASGPAIGGSVDGAKVSAREFVDIVNGTGSGRGYTTISKDGETAIYKHEGKIKTTMSDKGQPDTRFEGEAVNVKPGLGKKMGEKVAYKGYFTSPTDYVVEWRAIE
ncbi:MAG: hypothetical protein H0V78_14785 [Burkholderiales bacterium]|nr:hypothetical protein [Burkholderiales bacterium]